MAGEPTGAREHVYGPGMILTASVKGAREISAGRSPLAKQVARAVRARQNHAGGVPANCGSGEQVGRRPRLSIVAGEMLFDERREASFEPRDDLPPVAELEVFADGAGLAGLHAILAL